MVDVCPTTAVSSAVLGSTPGSIAPYVFIASLTFNACVVLFFCAIAAARLVCGRLIEKHQAAVTLKHLTEDSPWIVGKV